MSSKPPSPPTRTKSTLLAGTVSEPETEVPGGRAIDDLQTESLSAADGERVGAPTANAPGADGEPARPPTFTPL